MFRLLIFGIKINCQFDVVPDLFAYGMIVNIPAKLRSREDELAGAVLH